MDQSINRICRFCILFILYLIRKKMAIFIVIVDTSSLSFCSLKRWLHLIQAK